MAQTLQTQIENLTGSAFAAALYDDWLIAGARGIVDILKPEDMERHSTATEVPTTGLACSLYRVWRVLVGNNTAVPRDTGNESQVVDANSFYKATPFTPAYIVKSGVMKCYNGVFNPTVTVHTAGDGYTVGEVLLFDGGLTLEVTAITTDGNDGVAAVRVLFVGSTVTGHDVAPVAASLDGSAATFNLTMTGTASSTVGSLIGIQYPTAIDSSTDLDIVGIPENMHHAVVLYASIQARLKQMSDINTLMTTGTSGYLTTDEDIELAKASSDAYLQQIQEINVSMQQLQSEYHGIINMYLGVQQKEQA